MRWRLAQRDSSGLAAEVAEVNREPLRKALPMFSS